jgi:hypothetical protein
MKYLVILIALLLSACSTTEYAQYTKAQTDIAASKSSVESERYRALAEIAKAGDETSRTAAVMAIALSQTGNQPQVAAPAPNSLLQWASVLVPGLVQVYGIHSNAQVAINGSNNAAATSQATTAGFVNMAGLIQAPTTILSGTGTLGSGTYTPPSVVSPTVVQPVTPIVPTVVSPTVIEPTVITPVVQVVPVIK